MSICLGYAITVHAAVVISTNTWYLATAASDEKKMVRSSGGDLYFAYVRKYNGYYRVFVARSTNGGKTWSDTTAVPVETVGDESPGYNQGCPSLAIDSNDVLHLVWEGCNNTLDTAGGDECKIVYSSASLPGTSWSPHVKIPGSTYEGSEFGPSIAVDSTNGVHIVWCGQDDGVENGRVRYSSRSATSSLWTPYINISYANKETVDSSFIIDGSNNLHVVCRMSYGQYSHVYETIAYSSRTATGSWGAWQTIANISGHVQNTPCIVIDSSNNRHVVWSGRDGANQYNYQIKYSSCPAGSFTWFSWTNIQPISSASQITPSVGIDTSNILYAVWCGSDTSRSVYNVKQSRYINSAWTNWINITDASEDQSYPNIRWSRWYNNGGDIDVAWTGKVGSEYKIYFSKFLRAPRGVTLKNITQTQAKLTWAKELTAEGYVVYASTRSDSTSIYASSSTADVAITTLTVTGLMANATHYFKVGTLYGSVTAWMTTPMYISSSTLVSPPIIGMSSGFDTTGMTANWDANGNSSQTVYRVEVSTEPGFATITKQYDTPQGSIYQAIDGLSPNTQYCIRVTALSMSGDSSKNMTSGNHLIISGTAGFWRFNEGTGTTALDSAGNSSNGSFTGGPTWTTGIHGKALYFPNGGYITVPTHSSQDVSDFTCEMWIYPTMPSLYLTGLDPALTLISKRTSNTPQPYTFQLRYSYCRLNLEANYSLSAWQEASTNENVIQLNKWQHVAVTRENSGNNVTIKLYLNGKKIGQGGAAWGTPTQNSSQALIISRDQYHASFTDQGTYQGKMDELRLLNYTRSESEVMQDVGTAFNYTLANPPSGLTINNVYQSSVTLSWTGNGGSSFGLVCSSTDTFAYDVSTMTLTAQTTTFTELVLGTHYWFKVRGYNGDGAPTSYSATVSTWTFAPMNAKIWNGSSSSNWFDMNNWMPNTVPSSTDTVIINNGTFDPQLTSNVTIGSMTIQSGAELKLDGYDLWVSSDIVIKGSLTCMGYSEIVVGGNWQKYFGSYFSYSSSTVRFEGSKAHHLSGDNDFYCLEAFSPGATIYFEQGTTTSLSGEMRFTGITMRSEQDDNQWYIDYNHDGGDMILHVNLKDSNNISGWNLEAINCVNLGNNTNWDFFTVWEANSGSGYWDVTGTWWNGTVPPPDCFVFITKESTVTIRGATDRVAGIYIEGALRPDTAGSYTLTVGTTTEWGEIGVEGTFYSTNTAGILDVILSTGTIEVNIRNEGSSFNNFTIQDGATACIKSDIEVNTITIENGGILKTMQKEYYEYPQDPQYPTILVSGNWAANAGSTIQLSSATIEFIGSGVKNLIGSSTFYSLACLSTGATIQFEAGTTTYITGFINFDGPGLLSTSDGSPWFINYSGYDDDKIMHVRVKDSHNTGTYTLEAVNSADKGNNTNWEFFSVYESKQGIWPWENSSSWIGGSVPPYGAAVYIPQGSTVTVNSNRTVSELHCEGAVRPNAGTYTISIGTSTTSNNEIWIGGAFYGEWSGFYLNVIISTGQVEIEYKGKLGRFNNFTVLNGATACIHSDITVNTMVINDGGVLNDHNGDEDTISVMGDWQQYGTGQYMTDMFSTSTVTFIGNTGCGVCNMPNSSVANFQNVVINKTPGMSVSFSTATIINGDVTISSGNLYFSMNQYPYLVQGETHINGGNLNCMMWSNVTLNGTVTIWGAGNLNGPQNGRITFGAPINQTGGGFDMSMSTMVFTGTAGQFISVSTDTIKAVEVNKTGGSVTFQNEFNISETFIMKNGNAAWVQPMNKMTVGKNFTMEAANGGTFIATIGSTIEVRGNVNISGGSFNGSDATLLLSDTVGDAGVHWLYTNTGTTLFDLRIERSDRNRQVFAGSNITVDNLLYVTTGEFVLGGLYDHHFAAADIADNGVCMIGQSTVTFTGSVWVYGGKFSMQGNGQGNEAHLYLGDDITGDEFSEVSISSYCSVVGISGHNYGLILNGAVSFEEVGFFDGTLFLNASSIGISTFTHISFENTPKAIHFFNTFSSPRNIYELMFNTVTINVWYADAAGSSVTFYNCGGNSAGEDYDNDPYNQVNWFDSIDPTAVTDLIACTDKQIMLEWTAPCDWPGEGDTPVAGYIVKISTKNGGFYTDWAFYNTGTTYYQSWTPLNPGEKEKHVLSGLMPGVSYYISVKAYDNNNNHSMFSSSATVNGVQSGYFNYPYLNEANTYDTKCMRWGDCNNDGYLDFIQVNSNTTDKIKVYRQTGSNTFENPFTYSNANIFEDAAWGDYDNDGSLDFAVVSLANPSLQVFHNDDGSGNNFTVVYSTINIAGAKRAAWVDIDLDGDQDIIVEADYITLFRNAGGGNFSGVPISFNPAHSVRDMAIGDLNEDAEPDIITVETGGIIMRTIQEGQLDDNLIGLSGSPQYTCVAVGDMDNDGHLDIAAGGTDVLTVWRSIDADLSTFSVSWTTDTYSIDDISLGDYDNDGDLDIAAVRSATNETLLYKNITINQFNEDEIIKTLDGGVGRCVAWADYDRDYDLDILIGNNGWVNRVILESAVADNSMGNSPNTLPNPPNLGNIVFKVEKSTGSGVVMLEWDRAADSETPANGLYYEVMVGTQTGTESEKRRIISPSMASPLLGNYLRPKLMYGDPDALGVVIVPPLEHTTYYAWVRTIDTSFGRSSWSTAVSTYVSIPPAPITDLTAVPDPSNREHTINLSWTAPGDDMYIGTSSSYDIRISTNPMYTWQEVSAAPSVPSYQIPQEPHLSGSQEAAAITGLLSYVTYYFAVYAMDEVLNKGQFATNYCFTLDLSSPTIQDNQPGETVWRNYNPGAVYDVDFFDEGAGLQTVEYESWTGSNQTGSNTIVSIPLTLPGLTPGDTYYTDKWIIDFANLKDSATNYISVNLFDTLGHQKKYSDVFVVLKDTTPPVSGVSFPSTAYENYIDVISGTAADVPLASGVDTSEIRIYHQEGPGYWDGSGWIGISTWVAVSGVSNWNYAISSNTWINEDTYKINIKTRDTVGNQQTIFSTRTFIFDDEKPTAYIYQSTQTHFSSLALISGTSGDNISNIALVQLDIKRLTDNQYWHHTTGWDTGSSPNNVSDTLTWNLNVSTVTWENDKTYLLTLYLTDGAGNMSSSTVHQFTFDTAKPSVGISNPSVTRYSQIATISGTASDGANGAIDAVEYRIFSSIDFGYWNGTDFSGDETSWFLAQTTTTIPWQLWISTCPNLSWETDYQYRIEARTQDNAGNFGVSFATKTFVFDQDVPQSHFSNVASGSFINQLTTISGTAGDTGTNYVGSISIQPRVAIRRNSDGKWWNGTGFTSATLSPRVSIGTPTNWYYTHPTLYDLTSSLTNNVSYYMTTQSQDNAAPANVEDYYNVRGSTFTFDNEKPITSIQFPSNNCYFGDNKKLGVSSGTYSDNSAGLNSIYCVMYNKNTNEYFNGSSFGAGLTPLPAAIHTSSWTYSDIDLTDGMTTGTTYLMYVYGVDNAGNAELLEPATTIYYENDAPVSGISYPTHTSLIGTEPTILGTASDTGSGVQKVFVALRMDNPGFGTTGGAEDFAWTGSSWTVWINDIWLQATDKETWNFTIDISSWQFGNHYWVKSKAVDMNNSVETPGSGIMFVLTKPADHLAVTIPANVTAGSAADITIEALDDNNDRSLGYTGTVAFLTDSVKDTVPVDYTFLNTDEGYKTLTNQVYLRRAGANRTVTATDTVTPAITGISNACIVSSAAVSKALAVVDGEEFDPEDIDGKSNVVQGQTAGLSFPITVYATDAYFNVDTSTSALYTADTTDPHDTNPGARNFTNGTDIINHVFYTAGTHTISINTVLDGTPTDYTSSQIVVDSTDPVKVLLILPGQSHAPGSAEGITGKPSQQTAGQSFVGTVKLVDQYWNLSMNDAPDIHLKTSDVFDTEPSTAALVSGEQTFSITCITNSSVTVTAEDVDGIAPFYTQYQSTWVWVNHNAATKLGILLPGETLLSGSPAGKEGAPVSQTAGVSFPVSVGALDPYWNIVDTESRVIQLTTSDNYDTHPSNLTLESGTTEFLVTLVTAGNSTATATDTSGSPLVEGISSSVVVNPNIALKLQILFPGQTAVPGDTANAGRTGTISSQKSGSPFNATVRAVDTYFNLQTSSTPLVLVQTTDPLYGGPAGDTLVSGEKQFSLNFASKGNFGVWVSTQSGDFLYDDGDYVLVNDGIAPVITDLQPGDTTWHSVNTAAYNIRFDDENGGSLLSKFQTSVNTGVSQSGTELQGWTDVVTGINAYSYTAGWQLLSGTWNLMQSGTNYVSVRVYDNDGSTDTLVDAFYVLKDTVAVTVVDNESGDTAWCNIGRAYNIDFVDSYSLITGAEYAVYTATGADTGDGEERVAPTTIFTSTGTPAYTADWTIDFNALKDGVTNYVSVQAYDLAGNTTTVLDVFYVKKDTTVPTCFDNEPGDAEWRSTGRSYDINFYDAASSLAGADYKVDADAAEIISWTNIFNSAGISSYETDWPINFTGMKDGATNYVSVRIYDVAGNTETLSNVFYVLKDTTSPTCTNYEIGGDTNWTNSGRPYNVNFGDVSSGLSGASYAVYTQTGRSGVQKVPLTSIPAVSGASFSTDWTVNFSALEHDATNYVSVDIYDIAGNTTTLNDIFFIKKDATPPDSSVTAPTEVYRSTMTIVSGIASDASSGLMSVNIKIYDQNTLSWWNGTDAWDNGTLWWLPTTGTTSAWDINVSGVNWISGNTYLITPQAKDMVNNVEVDFSTYTFTFDDEPATSSITYPTGSRLASLTIISGTANDAISPLSSVQLEIKRQDGLYWNTSDWQSDSYLMSTSLAGGNWSINSSLPVWVDSVQYTLRIYVTDQAGNLQSSTTHQFYYDISGPEVAITAPYAVRQSSLPTISGTTHDDTNGVDEVKLRILNMTLSKYWDGAAFTILEANRETAWFVGKTTTTTPWDIWFNTFTWQNGRQYRIEAKVKDSAGNYGVSFATQTFIYDPDIPESYVVYPANGSYIKALTQITGTAHDTGTLNIGTLTQTLIAVRRNADSKWWDGATDFTSNTIDFQVVSGTPDNWTYPALTSTNMTNGASYYITTYCEDNATPANIESPYHVRSATFTYDNQNPASTIDYPANGTNFSSVKTLVTLSGALSDNCSGVTAVNVRILEKVTGDYFNGTVFSAGVTDLTATIYTSSWTYINTGLISQWAHGTYYMYAWAVDNAANYEALEPATTIYYDNILPVSGVGYPVHDTSISAEPTITGTAYDGDAGIAQIDISLRRDVSPYSTTPGAEDFAWDGSSWTAWSGDAWLTATDTTAWSFSIPVSSWVYASHYWVKSRSRDNSDLVETGIGDGNHFILAKPADHLSVTITSDLTAGQPGTVIVEAKDINNNRAIGYIGTVQFTTTFGPETAGNGLPSNYMFQINDEGFTSFTDQLTFRRANNGRTVTATDTVTPTITGISNGIKVSSAAVSRFLITADGEVFDPNSVSGKQNVPDVQTAGVAFPVTVYATDSYFNVVNSTDAAYMLSTSDVFDTDPGARSLIGGQEIINHTFYTAAVQTMTVTGTLSGAPTSYTSAPITVVPDAPVKLQFVLPGQTEAPGSSTGISGTPQQQTAGASFNGTVRLVDNYWNFNPSYDAQVQVNTSDLFDVEPATETTVSGQKTFAFTAVTSSSITLTAYDVDGSGPLYAQYSSTWVWIAPNNAAKLQVLLPGETPVPGSGKTGSPTTRTAGVSFNVSVNAVDNSFNTNASNTSTIHLTTTDLYDTEPANQALSAGSAVFTLTLLTAGSATVTAEDVGLLLTSDTSPSVTVQPGIADRLQLLLPGQTAVPGDVAHLGRTGVISSHQNGISFTVTVNAVDSYYNVQTSSTPMVQIVTSDPYYSGPAAQALAAGTQEFTADFISEGTFIMTVSTTTGDYLIEDSTAVVITDGTPPASITDLSAATGTADVQQVNLTWTAPGDDGSYGTAVYYDIRYATFSFSAAQFSGIPGTRIVGVTKSAHNQETYTVTGLIEQGSTYYFAIKTYDDGALSSAVDDKTVAGSPAHAVASIKTWTGTISTNWHTADNWTPYGVPTSTHPVDVPSTVNKPVISTPASTYDLVLMNGALLTVNANLAVQVTIENEGIEIDSGATLALNNSTITVQGSFINDGTFNAVNALVAFAGAGTHHLRSTTGDNICLAGGTLQLDAQPAITGDFILASGTTLNMLDETIFLNGSWFNYGGTVTTSGASQLAFTGSTNEIITGSHGGGSLFALYVSKGNATLTAQTGTALNFQSISVNTGNLIVNNGLTHQISGNVAVHSNGALTVDSGSTLLDVSGDVQINSGGLLTVNNGAEVDVTGSMVIGDGITSGTCQLMGGSTIKVDTALTVQNHGILYSNTSANQITSSIPATIHYAFAVNVATLNVTGLTVEGVNTTGIVIADNAQITNFKNITVQAFQNGSNGITVNEGTTSTNYTFDGIIFNDSNLTRTMRAPNLAQPGKITLTNYAPAGSEAKEYDPNNVITWVAETYPPNPVSNLTVASSLSAHGAVKIQFTAVADNPVGNAAVYQVKYATVNVTAAPFSGDTTAWWNAASSMTGEPVPAAAGSNESFEITGLPLWTTYYIALKTEDASGNISAFSNGGATPGAYPAELNAPVATTTLTGAVTSQVRLDTIAGTSYDSATPPSSGVKEVRVRILNELGQYWDGGTGFTTTPTDVAAAGTAPWSISVSTNLWTDNQIFRIYVKGIDNAGNAGAYGSPSFTYEIDATTPAAVTNLTAAPSGIPGEVALSFTVPHEDGTSSNSYLDHFVVGYQIGVDFNAGSFNVVSQRTIDNTSNWPAGYNASITVTGLTDEVTYFFHIKSADVMGNLSDMDTSANVWAVPGDQTAPEAVDDLSLSQGGSLDSITLTWSVPHEDGFSGSAPVSYTVAYATKAILAGNFYMVKNWLISDSSNTPVGSVLSLDITGLTNGLEYYFSIKSTDDMGNVSSLNTGIDASIVVGDASPPAAITDLRLTLGDSFDMVSLSWTVPFEDGATGGPPVSYVIAYATKPILVSNFENVKNWILSNGTAAVGDQIVLDITGLINGLQYYFMIRSTDDMGNNSDLNTGIDASVVVGDLTAPKQITDLTAATPGVGGGAVDLTWTVPYEDEGDITSSAPLSYDVRYSTSPFDESGYAFLEAHVLSYGSVNPGSRLTIRISNLTPGSRYYFRLTSIDDAGNVSAVSYRANALASYTTKNDITGKVTQADSSGITGAVVTIKRSGITVATVTTFEGVYRASGLTAGQTYTVEVAWTVDDVTSAVYIDSVAAGSGGVNFTLAIQYELATIEGQVIGVQMIARRNLAGAYRAPGGDAESYIDLLQHNIVVARVYTDLQGHYRIPCLLPGTYIARAFNGVSYSLPQSIALREGERVSLAFKFVLLKEKDVYNFPNPAERETTIRFISGAVDIEAQIQIFSIAGELVREIRGAELILAANNEYHYVWDLTNMNNEPVASGVYIYLVKVKDLSNGEQASVTKKLAIIK